MATGSERNIAGKQQRTNIDTLNRNNIGLRPTSDRLYPVLDQALTAYAEPAPTDAMMVTSTCLERSG